MLKSKENLFLELKTGIIYSKYTLKKKVKISEKEFFIKI